MRDHRADLPKIGEVTFYLSLPASTAGLSEAAAKVATPGSSNYGVGCCQATVGYDLQVASTCQTWPSCRPQSPAPDRGGDVFL